MKVSFGINKIITTITPLNKHFKEDINQNQEYEAFNCK